MRWHKWVVLIAGSTGSALRVVRPPNFTSHRLPGAISFTAQARWVLCNARPWPSWPRPSAQSCWQVRWRQPADHHLASGINRREPGRPTWRYLNRLSLSSAWLAPLNCGSLNSAHIHGTDVPVEEPSTASNPDFGRCLRSSEVLRDFVESGRLVALTCGRNFPRPLIYLTVSLETMQF